MRKAYKSVTVINLSVRDATQRLNILPAQNLAQTLNLESITYLIPAHFSSTLAKSHNIPPSTASVALPIYALLAFSAPGCNPNLASKLLLTLFFVTVIRSAVATISLIADNNASSEGWRAWPVPLLMPGASSVETGRLAECIFDISKVERGRLAGR